MAFPGTLARSRSSPGARRVAAPSSRLVAMSGRDGAREHCGCLFGTRGRVGWAGGGPRPLGTRRWLRMMRACGSAPWVAMGGGETGSQEDAADGSLMVVLIVWRDEKG